MLSVSAVCIYTIVVLTRVKSLLEQTEKEMKEMTSRALPVLDNLEFVTGRAKAISESIEEQVGSLQDSLAAIRTVAEDVVALERKAVQRVEGPILETLAYVAAIVNGVRVFLSRLRI